MTLRPWALDNLIVSDGSSWTSVIREGKGLPEVSAQLVPRLGVWPRVSGVRRPGRKLFLETVFECPSDLSGDRERLLQMLNPERETIRRLMAADSLVPGAVPGHVLWAGGPWDVYRGAATWYVRDLLQQADATLAGGWWTQPGGGFQIARATTNKVLNPVGGATGNVAALGGATVTLQSTTQAWRANYTSVKVVTTAAANDGANYTLAALANAIHYASLWVYGAWATQEWSVDAGSTYHAPSVLGNDGTWYLYGYQFSAAEANASTSFRVRQTDATARTVYLGHAQVEQLEYPTPACQGALGPGHAWAGTVHGSASSRTAATASADLDVSATAGTVALWWRPAAANTGPDRYLWESAAGPAAWFKSLDDKIYLTDGTSTVRSAAQTFAAETWMHLAFTWSSSTLAIYLNGVVLATSAISGLGVLAGQCDGELDGVLVLDRALSASEVGSLYATGRDRQCRWVDCLCEWARPMDVAGQPSDYGMVSQLAVDGDPRWRSRDGDFHAWRAYDADERTVVEVQSGDDVYPQIYVTPKTAKTTGYAYRRFMPVVWQASLGATTYPVLLGPIDTTGLVSGGKMQADGDDWRVRVDGVEVDRWLGAASGAAGGPNSATTKTWVNLDFEAGQSVTLGVAIASSGAISTITAAASIAGFPTSGLLLIDSEVFTYTGKNDASYQFQGVTRAARGTSAAAHTTADTIYWIQHEIYILYGNASATTPTVDADYEPAFELDLSTNDSWVYEEFGEDDLLRPGQWVREVVTGTPTFYGGDQGAAADPWVEVGMVAPTDADEVRAYIYNPCYIVEMAFTNGEHYFETSSAQWLASVAGRVAGGAWTGVGTTIPAPSSASTWDTWSETSAMGASDYLYAGLWLRRIGAGGDNFKLEAADCTATLNALYTPAVTTGGEETNYDLACTITNETTGDAIELSASLNLDDVLEIDTDAKTVELMATGLNQRNALTLTGGARRDWLRLVDGENTLRFEDTGTAHVEIEILWDRRMFE